MSTCESVREGLEGFVVDLSPPAERRAVERHLGECAECRASFQRVRRIEESLMAGGDVPPAVVEAGLARLRRALEEERRAPSPAARRSMMPLIAAASFLTGIFAWVVAPHLQDVSPTKLQEPSFQEQKLATLPEGVRDYVVSPDGRSAAYVEQNGDKHHVVVAGERKSDTYDAVTHLSYTRAGVLTYTARAGGRSILVFGKETFDPEPAEAEISADGARIVSRFEREGRALVRVSGKEYGPYDEVTLMTPTTDGGRVAFVARFGERWCLVVDGESGKPYEVVSHPRWAPDGSRVAYRARVGHEKERYKKTVKVGDKKPEDSWRIKAERWVTVVGTRESDVFDEVGEPVFREDGGEVAFRARVKDGWFVVAGERRGDEYDEVGEPRYSPDGRILVNTARLAKQWHLVVNGRAEPVSSNVYEYAFAGGRVAAVLDKGTNDAQMFVRVGDESGPVFEWIGGLRFVRSGDRDVVVHVAQSGGWAYVVVDHVAGPRFRQTGPCVFSADGRRLAYAALRSGKRVMVTGVVKAAAERPRLDVDYRIGEDYDEVGQPVFSRDGKQVAFAARKGREVLWKVTSIE